MHPHKVTIDAVVELGSLATVPRKEDQIALSRGMLLDITHFTLAKARRQVSSRDRTGVAACLHLGTPIPGITEVIDQSARFATIIDTCGIHPGVGTSLHLDSGTVGPVFESSCLRDTSEILI